MRKIWNILGPGFMLMCLVLLLFHAMLGPNALALLHPQSIDWTLGGDIAYQVFAFQSFLGQDWQWPLGSFQGYLYASPINLFLADAIPWWSVLLKIFLGTTREAYQFVGLWLFLCCLLQVHASYLLAKVVYEEFYLRAIVTIALSFSTFLIFRWGHPALCAHFFILYGLWLVLKSQEFGSKKTIASWAVTLFLAAGIHPYFVPMLILIAAASPFVFDRTSSFKAKSFHSLGLILLLGLMTGFVFWLFGAEGTPRDELKPVSFYVGDVFIFFNSMNRAYLPQLWAPRMGQVEGFAYLGLAWVLLFLISLGLFFRRRKEIYSRIKASPLFPLLIACLILGFWSLGENIRFFGQWLISLEFLYKPFHPIIASFRAAGRFVWPLAYLLILFLPKFIKDYAPALSRNKFFWIALILLQLADTSKAWFPHIDPKESRLSLDPEVIAQLVTADVKYLDLWPPDLVNTPCRNPRMNDTDYIPLALVAHELGLAFNSGNRANPPHAKAREYCHGEEVRGREKTWLKDRLYVFDREEGLIDRALFRCLDLDRWFFCRLNE